MRLVFVAHDLFTFLIRGCLGSSNVGQPFQADTVGWESPTYRCGGLASRTTAPCSSLSTSSENFFTKSSSLVLSDV